MKIAVVVSPKNGESRKSTEIGKVVCMALEKRGYSVDLINTTLDTDRKLTIFDYLVFVTETASYFSKKLSPSLEKYLKTCGTISGKRCAVILTGKTLFKSAAMASLMKMVEAEGVILKTSEICTSAISANAFAGKINVERNY